MLGDFNKLAFGIMIPIPLTSAYEREALAGLHGPEAQAFWEDRKEKNRRMGNAALIGTGVGSVLGGGLGAILPVNSALSDALLEYENKFRPLGERITDPEIARRAIRRTRAGMGAVGGGLLGLGGGLLAAHLLNKE